MLMPHPPQSVISPLCFPCQDLSRSILWQISFPLDSHVHIFSKGSVSRGGEGGGSCSAGKAMGQMEGGRGRRKGPCGIPSQ